MSNTYKCVTLVGTSPTNYEDAIRSAIADASGSLRNIYWYEVKEMRGKVTDGKVAEFQVKIQVGFKVETG